MTLSRRALRWSSALAVTATLWGAGPALADGTPGNTTPPPPPPHNDGGASGKEVYASTGRSQIQVTYLKGGKGGGKKGNLAPIDPNWEPPACWYEPIFTPEQLKDFVKDSGGDGPVNIHRFWYGEGLWTDHYRDGKATDNMDDGSAAPGYKDYNIGKKGYFWRSVAPDDSHPDSWDCGRTMFWQDAGEIPKVPEAPTPKTLAEYAYDKVKIPETDIELKPQAKSTVNLPTWVWLDKGTFKDVKVRAALPKTDLWAETTAKPKSLHLEPGTDDAETFPASGECAINDDGSIGTPYQKGDSKEEPPCGIKYLRATDGEPYQLKASVTWEISWQGSDNDGVHAMPDGTFETTQEMNVQEVQSINR